MQLYNFKISSAFGLALPLCLAARLTAALKHTRPDSDGPTFGTMRINAVGVNERRVTAITSAKAGWRHRPIFS
jgi:hypothetical protein